MREDFRLAYLSAVVTNLAISIHGKHGTKLSTPMEFMLDWDLDGEGATQTQSAEEMKSILLALADSHNKTIAKSTKLDNTKPPKFKPGYTKGL
jgi:hypothetical protein